MRDETFLCVQGSSRSGTGAYGTCASVAGIFTCSGSCTSEIFTPSLPAETCNGLDDDCDGAPDDTFACVRGATGLGCTTMCGTAGSRTCTMMCTLPSACYATSETCNDCDDDGDGTADDGFACPQGSGMACTTGCGTAGMRPCRADCSGYEACRAMVDVCNGCDDDVDGVPDNGPGLSCERAAVRGCSTACGTFGTQACNMTCTGYSACGAASETCNYCDDDADGTVGDEISLATEMVSTSAGNCAQYTLTSASCADPTATLTQATMAPDFGSIWQNQTIPFGYGTVELNIEIDSAAIFPGMGYPSGGFAVLLVDDTGGMLNTTPGTLGVPYDREGIAIEWRYTQTRPGMEEVDQITVRRLTGSGTGVDLGQFNVGFSACGGACQLNSDAAMSPRAQHLRIRYTPDDPRTMAMNEELLTVGDTLGTGTIFMTSGINPGFATNTMLRAGVTAENDVTGRPTTVTANVRMTRTTSQGLCP
jgi:hypothetical protein